MAKAPIPLRIWAANAFNWYQRKACFELIGARADHAIRQGLYRLATGGKRMPPLRDASKARAAAAGDTW